METLIFGIGVKACSAAAYANLVDYAGCYRSAGHLVPGLLFALVAAAALLLVRKRREEALPHFAGRLQLMKHLGRGAQDPHTDSRDQSHIHHQHERRQSERAEVLTPAIIVLSPEKKIMCQALDISAGGARLKLRTQRSFQKLLKLSYLPTNCERG
jgi:hypothetical protein